MPRREKFGSLVLLGERDASPIGTEHLAARLGPTGLDRLVSVMCYAPAVSGHADAVRLLADEARRAAQLHDAGLARVLGVGRVGTTFYVSSEHVEGRSLAAVVARCRSERFPFAVDNALLVASRVAGTLGFLHGRRDDSGTPLFHGLLVPRHVLVTYAGEVKLTGLGLWPGLRQTGLLGDDDMAYLAPEQKRGNPGDARSDVYSLGLLVLEMLTLERPRGPDPGALAGATTILGPSGDREPMPPAVAEILTTALALDEAARYAGPGEMRGAIDALLFSGELSSTTFNLAFFMHTLFRQDVEEETRLLEEARTADYAEYLASSGGAVPGGPEPPTVPEPGRPDDPPSGEPAATQPAATEPGPTLPSDLAPTVDAPGMAGFRRDEAARRGGRTHDDAARRRTAAPGESARTRTPRSPDASSSGRVHRRRGRATAAPGRGGAPTGRRGLLLLAALLAALGVGGIVGYTRLPGQRGGEHGPAPTTTLSPEAQAALARVRELEARIAELEAEQAAAEARVASPDPAPATPSPGRAAAGASAAPTPAGLAPSDPGAAQRQAQERARAEARRRAEAERQRRADELRLLELQKQEAEARLVLEQARGVVDGAVQLPTVAPPPPTPAPTMVPPPARGSLAELSDPDVTPPVLVRDARADYPPAAERARKEATVVLDVLVDEDGRVAEARVVEPAEHRLGFEAAALRMVRQRRYQPATKRGVPVKVHLSVRVAFTLAE